ncbi:hypothetical protein [Actinacidiphila rubida]|uniref:TPM domain-containing protein n=1 Tax=Actinacidiphila rubida TaxID=310780 RepID=A0A1H8V4E2_9ACTN|nr:hypothetical protein [Actinacidiphila rubida]SEP10299.1 hypothetical protein SAMN05216267_11061 [Actinacidiphila rubida]
MFGESAWLRSHGRTAALLLGVLLAGLLAAAGPAAAEPSAGARIADALAASPVYVDPAYASAVPSADRTALAARIGRTRLPIKVALVPLVKGDAFDGDPQVLTDVLHERLGLRDVILVTLEPTSDGLFGAEWPDGRHQAFHAVAAVGFQGDMRDAGLAARLDRAVDLIARGDGDRVYQQATASLDGTPAPPVPQAKGGSSAGGSVLPVILGAAFAVLLCAGGVLWLVRRRRAGRRHAAPFAFPEAVFAAEEAADEAALRRRAEAEVIALGELLDDADPGRPFLREALDAYAAAGKVLDAARSTPDLVGVLVLVTQGRDAHEGREDALPLCFFDPLHGRAARRLDWRPLGRTRALHVAACRACADAVRGHRAPEVLTDVDPAGRRVPYFEVPAARSVWAATGYGAMALPGRASRDDPDALVPRVLRGTPEA